MFLHRTLQLFLNIIGLSYLYHTLVPSIPFLRITVTTLLQTYDDGTAWKLRTFTQKYIEKFGRCRLPRIPFYQPAIFSRTPTRRFGGADHDLLRIAATAIRYPYDYRVDCGYGIPCNYRSVSLYHE